MTEGEVVRKNCVGGLMPVFLTGVVRVTLLTVELLQYYVCRIGLGLTR